MSSMFIKSKGKKGIFGDGKNQGRARAVLPIFIEIRLWMLLFNHLTGKSL